MCKKEVTRLCRKYYLTGNRGDDSGGKSQRAIAEYFGFKDEYVVKNC